MRPKQVCVIGAGCAGLVALKLMAEKPELYKATAFERGSGIGGTWVYSDITGKDKDGQWVHSAVYKNLKTNVPKELMELAGFPFPEDLPSFITHKDFYNYLDSFCKHFKLEKNIQLQTSVTKVKPQETSEGLRWLVTVKPLDGSDTETYEFDAVMLCTGHFTVPRVPEVKGQDLFKGRIMHSRDYRCPEMFQDQKVLLLGASFSGLDIAQDLTNFVEKIYLCHYKQLIKLKMQENIIQKPVIRELKEHTAILENGEEIEVDAIIFCTGYKYVFPFLDSSCAVDVKSGSVTPLYKHVIHVNYPSLSFIGMSNEVVRPSLPKVLEYQARFVLSSLEGRLDLPSREKMLADIDTTFEWYRNKQSQKTTLVSFTQHYMEYFQELSRLGHFEPPPKVFHTMVEFMSQILDSQIVGFRNATFKVLNDKEFAYMPLQKENGKKNKVEREEQEAEA